VTNAGWYPDPAGTPDTYRYWDGQAWSHQTSTDPYSGGQPSAPQPPPFAPQAPTQLPPSYGAVPGAPQQYPSTPQWSPMPGSPGGPGGQGGSGAGKVIAIVAGAVVVLVLLAVIAFVAVKAIGGGKGNDTAGSSPTTGGTPGSPVAPQPSKPLGTITPSTTQCDGASPSLGPNGVGTTISGGGITSPSLTNRGYSASPRTAKAFGFAEQATAVAEDVTGNWVSPLMVGAVPKADGFSSVESAARATMVCTANDRHLYKGAYSLKQISASATKVDGHSAFSLIEDIRVHEAGLTVPGDRVQIVVVDTGNPKSYGIWLMAVPIGNGSLEALQRTTSQQLHVK